MQEGRRINGVRFYTLKETAKLLGVSYLTAWKYVVDGKIEALYIGGRYLISEHAINKFLVNQSTRRLYHGTDE